MVKKQIDKNETINIKNKKLIIEFKKLIEQIKYDIDHASTKDERMTNYYRLRQINNIVNIDKIE